MLCCCGFVFLVVGMMNYFFFQSIGPFASFLVCVIYGNERVIDALDERMALLRK